MKETGHNSRKHSKQSNNKRPDKNGHTDHSSDKYRNVLKERHYKEVTDRDKSEKNRRIDSKASNSEDRKRSTEHVSRRNHAKSSKQLEVEKHRSRKHDQLKEESYEELSRKKRKIESELQALDLEEAAEKEAESKRSEAESKRREAESKRREAESKRRQSEEASRKKKEVPRSKQKVASNIKQELFSDDDRERRNKEKSKHTRPGSNGGRNQRPNTQPSNSSGDEGRWGNSQAETQKPEKVKEKPNFAVSGKLAEDTNTYNGVVIKYNEPSEARKPKRKWRLYPFKGDSDLPFIPIHRQSAYLFGRTRSIADIPIDHPSCSKQHAVLQFRLVPYKREDGTTGRRVRPYVIDLESSNGTYVNNKRVDPRCYVELMEKDVVKFGYSSREYVVLHEESKNEEEDDDVLDSGSEKE